MLRDVEKETHKQQVLWEKKLVYLKSGWDDYKNYCVKFPIKNDQFLIFSVLSWGGGHGRGATITKTIIIITTTKVVPPLGAENSEFPILLSSCSGM